MRIPVSLILVLILVSCNFPGDKNNPTASSLTEPAIRLDTLKPDTTGIKLKADIPGDADTSIQISIRTSGLIQAQVVEFAKSLIGVPYKYGSTDPLQGFDCSGFITYVFNHFKIAVPRSSKDFEHVGVPVDTSVSKPGDLILFTGTDSTLQTIGHMGIVISNDNGNIQFIHSSSGKVYGVVITPLNDYYKSRFVKVIRVFR